MEQDCVNMLLLCGEIGGKRDDETPAQYLRRLIDELIRLQEFEPAPHPSGDV